MGLPPGVSSAGMGRLFPIFIYVNILILLPARTHGSTPLQLTSGSAGSAPCFASGLPMQPAPLIFSSRRLVASGIDVCVDVQMKLERRVNIDDANQLVIDEFLDAQRFDNRWTLPRRTR